MSKKNKATVTPSTQEDVNLVLSGDLTVDAATGRIVNPYTKEIIVQISGGLLDVRRPSGSQYPRPTGVKVTPANVGAAFGKWYYESAYCGAEVTDAEVEARTGIKGFVIPKADIDSPFAMVEADIAGSKWCFLYVGGKVCRVGQIGPKSIRWTFPTKMLEQRGKAMCPRAITVTSSEEAFRAHLSSFSGKFVGDHSAEKTSKATPTKGEKTSADPKSRKSAAQPSTGAKVPPARKSR